MSDETAQTAMASWLFVPGDSARKQQRAGDSGADILILDLEDAVAPAVKPAARATVAVFLATTVPPRRFVRVNALDTGLTEEDVAATLPGRPDGYVLPKATGPHDLAALSALIERHGGGPEVGIMAIATESARGMRNLMRLDWSHPRLVALSWGGEDLAADLGAARNRNAAGEYLSPFLLARDLVLLAARDAGVAAIDAVFPDVRDLDGLRREAGEGADLGFDGKMAIHPDQIAVIHAAQTPDTAKIARARAVLAALAAADDGVALLDGQMLDQPHRRQALRTLARQR